MQQIPSDRQPRVALATSVAGAHGALRSGRIGRHCPATPPGYQAAGGLSAALLVGVPEKDNLNAGLNAVMHSGLLFKN